MSLPPTDPRVTRPSRDRPPGLDLAYYRRQFPVCERLTYLNHAAVSPIATPTRAAMEFLLADVHGWGASHWQQWVEEQQATRVTLARFIGARPEEIALLKNTSEGISSIAQGLDWRPGDRVVALASEFPSNVYPWLALTARGVKVELLREGPEGIELEMLRQACRGARLLAVSFVQYLSGFRLDPQRVGEICRETGTLFFVDAIQGLGAFPLDVKHAGIHALAADGHKWLTGPEGAALLYVDQELLPQLLPHEIGWTSVEHWNDFDVLARLERGEDPLVWRSTAARFEAGTLNTVGIYGLHAAVEFLMGAGTAAIAARILALTDRLVHGLQAEGYSILGPRGNPHARQQGFDSRSGIVSFRCPRRAAAQLNGQLLRAGIQCAARGDWVRVAPHFYNSEQEIDRLLDELKRVPLE
ncbi:MAG: aminotransferase class V-fold PLP-dependent enzyme [Terriglobales bacterium]